MRERSETLQTFHRESMEKLGLTTELKMGGARIDRMEKLGGLTERENGEVRRAQGSQRENGEARRAHREKEMKS